ncbi:hypothetical protein Tco_0473837, partial [Tanacetum coccineum]
NHVSPPEWCHVACQPSPEPPPDHRSTVVNDSDQRRSTMADHRSTAIGHQSTVESNGGHRCHMAAKWYHVAVDVAADVA